MIETTVNLDSMTYFKLINTAETNKLKLMDIVHLLFKQMLIERHLGMPDFKRVRYQDRVEGRVWKVMHLFLVEGSYETCLDLRKLHKMSVSALLQVAVDMYLELVIKILKKSPDSNPANYFFFKKNSTPLPSYAVFYDFPPEEILKYFLSDEEP